MNIFLPLFFSGAMALISGFLLLHSFIWPPHSPPVLDTSIGVMYYPRVVLSIWLGCAIVLFFQNLFKKRLLTLHNIDWKCLGISIGLTLLVCLLFDFFGFLPGCIVFCFLYPFLLGYKNSKILIPFCVLYTVLLWYVFNKILLIHLPEIPWL